MKDLDEAIRVPQTRSNWLSYMDNETQHGTIRKASFILTEKPHSKASPERHVRRRSDARRLLLHGGSHEAWQIHSGAFEEEEREVRNGRLLFQINFLREQYPEARLSIPGGRETGKVPYRRSLKCPVQIKRTKQHEDFQQNRILSGKVR